MEWYVIKEVHIIFVDLINIKQLYNDEINSFNDSKKKINFLLCFKMKTKYNLSNFIVQQLPGCLWETQKHSHFHI